MTQHLSKEELAEFREIFNLVDRDGGGTITKEELGELMDTLGIDATPEEIDLMINEIDQDSNGEIDFEGGVTGYLSHRSSLYVARRIRRGHVKKSKCHIHIRASEECLQGWSNCIRANDTAYRVYRMQIFESSSPSGHIHAEALQKALMTYGSEKLTKDQAAELVSQVISSRLLSISLICFSILQLEPDQNGLINYVWPYYCRIYLLFFNWPLAVF